MTASHRSSDVLQRASHDRLAHALAQQGCDQHISYGVEYDPIVTCASAGAREKLSPITLFQICSEASKHVDTRLEGFVLLFIPNQRVTVHDAGMYV